MTLKDSIPLWLRAPRNTLWLLAAVVLLVLLWLISPVQLPVILYKVTQVALFGVVGYWLDRAVAPYSRPDGYLVRDWRRGTDEPEGQADYPIVPGYGRVFCAAMLRRAIIMGAAMLSGSLGL